MKSELISVIVPIFNVENYLEDCLNSICNQRYEELEIILIDDGSTDASGAICDKFALNDFRIRVIHQKNQGLSGARNAGIKIATGAYITFVDSDDFIAFTMLEKLYHAAIGSQADIASCGMVNCDLNGVVVSEAKVPNQLLYIRKEQMKIFLKESTIGTAAWGKLYRRRIFEQLQFPLGKYHEDVFTTYLAVDLSQKYVIIPEALYWYRNTPNSITKGDFKLKHLDCIEGAKLRSAFICMHYPHLSKYADASIVYNCCATFERMIKSHYRNDNIEKELQKEIKRNVLKFLRYSKVAFATKGFALCTCVSVPLAIKLYHAIRGKR